MNGNKCIDLGVRAAPAQQRSAHGSAALSIKKDSQITHAAIVGFDFFPSIFGKENIFGENAASCLFPFLFSTLSITALPLRVLTQKPKTDVLHYTSHCTLFEELLVKNNLVHFPEIKQNGKGYLKGSKAIKLWWVDSYKRRQE